jgi:hypothetical protein
MGRWREGAEAVRHDPRLRAACLQRADAAAAREMQLFGDGAVSVDLPQDYLRDPRTGWVWPLAFHHTIDYRNLGQPSDVKVAWELSRLRHVVALSCAAAVKRDAGGLDAVGADLAGWRETNPMGWSVNWSCPMEVALRAVNLICTFGVLRAHDLPIPDAEAFAANLYEHGWFLARHLEISDVNGNHFLADAVGLVWLGQAFNGLGEADRWLATGRSMVLSAVREQLFADGTDHEGSLPYHVLVVEMFVVARAVDPHGLASADATLARALEVIKLASFPGGGIAALGDDDGGRVLAFSDAPSSNTSRVLALGASVLGREDLWDGRQPEDAAWLTGRGAWPSARTTTPGLPTRLRDAGLIFLGGNSDRIVCDVGPVGFRGRGGHGHLDALSFVAMLDGCEVVRDSGTGSYTGDPELRQELRGARSHTAVLINGASYAVLGGNERLWAIDGDSPPEVIEVSGDDHAQRAIVRQVIGSGCVTRTWCWAPGSLAWSDAVDAPAGTVIEHVVQVPDATQQLSESSLQSGRARYTVHMPPGATLSLERCRRSDAYASVSVGLRAVITYRHSGRSSRVELRVSVT